VITIELVGALAGRLLSCCLGTRSNKTIDVIASESGGVAGSTIQNLATTAAEMSGRSRPTERSRVWAAQEA
jgi:hypothetical protein